MKMSKMFSTKFNVVVNNNYLCQYMYMHVCMTLYVCKGTNTERYDTAPL